MVLWISTELRKRKIFIEIIQGQMLLPIILSSSNGVCLLKILSKNHPFVFQPIILHGNFLKGQKLELLFGALPLPTLNMISWSIFLNFTMQIEKKNIKNDREKGNESMGVGITYP